MRISNVEQGGAVPEGSIVYRFAIEPSPCHLPRSRMWRFEFFVVDVGTPDRLDGLPRRDYINWRFNFRIPFWYDEYEDEVTLSPWFAMLVTAWILVSVT